MHFHQPINQNCAHLWIYVNLVFHIQRGHLSNVLGAVAVLINVCGVLGNKLGVLKHRLVNRIYLTFKKIAFLQFFVEVSESLFNWKLRRPRSEIMMQGRDSRRLFYAAVFNTYNGAVRLHITGRHFWIGLLGWGYRTNGRDLELRSLVLDTAKTVCWELCWTQDRLVYLSLLIRFVRFAGLRRLRYNLLWCPTGLGRGLLRTLHEGCFLIYFLNKWALIQIIRQIVAFVACSPAWSLHLQYMACCCSVLTVSLRRFTNHCNNSVNWFCWRVTTNFRVNKPCLRVFLTRLRCLIVWLHWIPNLCIESTTIKRIASLLFVIFFD